MTPLALSSTFWHWTQCGVLLLAIAGLTLLYLRRGPDRDLWP